MAFRGVIQKLPVLRSGSSIARFSRPLGSSFVSRRFFSTENKESILYAPAPPGFERETVLDYGEAEKEFKELLADEESNGKESLWTITKRYGSVPFAAALTVGLIQNEIIPLNEELFLAANFSVAMAAIYFKGSDAMKKWYEDTLNQAKKRQEDWDQLSIDVMDNNIKELQVSMHAPEVYREYQREYIDAAKAYMQYEWAKPRHEARAAMLKRLAEIKAQLDDQVVEQRKQLANKTLAHFHSKWQGNPQLRAQIVNQAIDNLGKKADINYETDPVVGLFNEYLKSQNRQPLKA
jgi:hypothetical protein